MRPGAKLAFRLYVEFRGQYLKYKESTDTFDKEIFDKFKEKKIKKVFIEPEQEPLYLEYLDETLSTLAEKSAPVSERADFAAGTMRREAENIERSLESEAAYRKSEDRIQKVVDFMLAEPKALAGMLNSAGLSVDDSGHGSSVSSMVLGVGVSSQWFEREELTDMAVAALLHDAGLKKLGFEAADDYNSLDKDRKKEYRKHPQVSSEMVAGKQFVTTRVLRIIEDHEEYGEGKGYPNKKRYSKLANDSQVFNVCDALDHYAMVKKKSPAEALEDFVAERGEDYDLQILEILEKQMKA